MFYFIHQVVCEIFFICLINLFYFRGTLKRANWKIIHVSKCCLNHFWCWKHHWFDDLHEFFAFCSLSYAWWLFAEWMWMMMLSCQSFANKFWKQAMWKQDHFYRWIKFLWHWTFTRGNLLHPKGVLKTLKMYLSRHSLRLHTSND